MESSSYRPNGRGPFVKTARWGTGETLLRSLAFSLLACLDKYSGVHYWGVGGAERASLGERDWRWKFTSSPSTMHPRTSEAVFQPKKFSTSGSVSFLKVVHFSTRAMKIKTILTQNCSVKLALKVDFIQVFGTLITQLYSTLRSDIPDMSELIVAGGKSWYLASSRTQSKYVRGLSSHSIVIYSQYRHTHLYTYVYKCTVPYTLCPREE